jgi:hypothetical protein
MQQEFDEVDVREIALVTGRDVRTVRKALTGARVHPFIRAQVQRELARRTARQSNPPPAAA